MLQFNRFGLIFLKNNLLCLMGYYFCLGRQYISAFLFSTKCICLTKRSATVDQSLWFAALFAVPGAHFYTFWGPLICKLSATPDLAMSVTPTPHPYGLYCHWYSIVFFSWKIIQKISLLVSKLYVPHSCLAFKAALLISQSFANALF